MLHRVVQRFVCSVLLSAPILAQDPNDEVKCNYQSRQVCTKTNCQPTPTAEFVSRRYILVPSLSKLISTAQLPGGGEVEIRLCDAQGCKIDSMFVSISGGFLDLTDPGRGTQFMRIYYWSQPDPMFGNRQGDFMEGEQYFLRTVVGFGHCQFPKP